MIVKISKYFFHSEASQILDESGRTIATLSYSESKILSHLCLNINELCLHKELVQIGWGGRPISDSSLTVAITNIRKVIKKLDVSDLKINNVNRKGYFLSDSGKTIELDVQDVKGIKDVKSKPREGALLSSSTKNKASLYHRVRENLMLRGSLPRCSLLLTTILFAFLLFIYSTVNYDGGVSCLDYQSSIVCSTNMDDIDLGILKEHTKGSRVFIGTHEIIIFDDVGKKLEHEKI